MRYQQADYETIMVCPNCRMRENLESDGMPERDDFVVRTDDDGDEYIECMCGCKFIDLRL